MTDFVGMKVTEIPAIPAQSDQFDVDRAIFRQCCVPWKAARDTELA